MEGLDFPPFLVSCRDFVPPRRQLAAGQVKNAAAAVLVCKDLPGKLDREV